MPKFLISAKESCREIRKRSICFSPSMGLGMTTELRSLLTLPTFHLDVLQLKHHASFFFEYEDWFQNRLGQEIQLKEERDY